MFLTYISLRVVLGDEVEDLFDVSLKNYINNLN
jgi:hypothetical protein